VLQKRGEVAATRALLEPIYAWFPADLDVFDLREARPLLDELRA
jgi:hypothetical protein